MLITITLVCVCVVNSKVVMWLWKEKSDHGARVAVALWLAARKGFMMQSCQNQKWWALWRSQFILKRMFTMLTCDIGPIHVFCRIQCCCCCGHGTCSCMSCTDFVGPQAERFGLPLAGQSWQWRWHHNQGGFRLANLKTVANPHAKRKEMQGLTGHWRVQKHIGG